MNAHDLTTADRYCIFRAAGSTFAISVLSVCEIAERPPLVAIPAAPAELAGLCHFRNEFVPVLDLARFLGTPASDCRKDDFILVLTGYEGTWALPIEKGIALEPLEIAYAASSDDTQTIIGTASFREEIVQVLDADTLYHSAVSMLESRWQGVARGRPFVTASR